MLEITAVFAVIQVLLATVNIVACLWDHDTKTILPWLLSWFGWFVVALQMAKRISDGEGA